MRAELQQLFTKEHFSQLRGGLNGLGANNASHGFPTSIHCARLHSPVMALLVSQWGLHVKWSQIHDTLKWRKTKLQTAADANTCCTLALVIITAPVWLLLFMLPSKIRRNTQKRRKETEFNCS